MSLSSSHVSVITVKQSERTNLIEKSGKFNFESNKSQKCDQKTEPEEEFKSFDLNINDDVENVFNTTNVNKEKEKTKLDYEHNAILLSCEYIQPRDDDYINCIGDIATCNVIRRVIHLLKYHKNMHTGSSNNEENVFQLYEYIVSLPNYAVPIVMEDWYHCKNKHFKLNEDINLFQNDYRINCNNNARCINFQRNQRNRASETFHVSENIDHKNIILMDHMDSVHMYIFHSPINDICSSLPIAIEQCNSEQIAYIVTQVILNKPKKTLQKLETHKLDIISYITQHNINGSKLVELERKNFMNKMVEHFTNKKLKMAFGQLYTATVKYLDTNKKMKQNNNSENKQTININKMSLTKQKSNKFVTPLTKPEKCIGYYAFGTQYRYTKNLATHPLYVNARYDSVKNELLQFYKSVNENTDKRILLCTQLEKIKMITDNSQFVLVIEQLLLDDQINDDCLKNIWLNQNDLMDMAELKEEKWIEEVDHLEKLAFLNYQYMFDLIVELFQNLSTEFMFIKFMQIYVELINKRIEQNLIQYVASIQDTELNQLLNEINKYLKEKALALYWKILTRTYNNIFSSHVDDSDYFTTHIKPYLKVNQAINWREEYIYLFESIVKNKRIVMVDAFYEMMVIDEESMSHIKTFHYDNVTDKLETLIQLISSELCQTNKTEIKQKFISIASKIIRSLGASNRDKYVEYQNMQRYKHFSEKATIQSRMNSVKKMKAIWYHGINQAHQIPVNTPLSLQHIISLICYTDDTTLCTTFRETYRRMDAEDVNQQISRHAVFANLGRLLYESFAFYASTNSKVTLLYHGMSIPLKFSTLFCAFDAPTSTTTDRHVAERFCSGTGILIYFKSAESSQYIRTLDMSLFSCFDSEQEHLIFETRLHIQNIFIPTERSFVRKKWMKTLLLYDLLVHGNVVNDKMLLKTKNQQHLYNMLKLIIQDKIETIPSVYLRTLIKSLTVEKQQIWWNLNQLQELDVNLKEMFVKNGDEFGEFILYLLKEFHIKIIPIFRTKWIMSEETLLLISRATDKYENIVIAGLPVTCNLSDSKAIVFQPELTKVNDLIEIQMKLSKGLHFPVKVHLNLSCKELNDYYISLHPRMMNVKYYNKFSITLPSVADNTELKSISLELSIMLHNFEFDYKDNSQLNTVTMIQNMVQTKKSYKCADILSIFYGISNSIVSVSDSISDGVFIYVLFSYYVANEAVSNSFLFLTIGNLISVAIIIASYQCYKFKVKFPTTKHIELVVCFVGFFLLSPFLACLDWLVKRMRIENKRYLTVHPSDDGILLCFQQEQVRNKLFLIECLFESCF
eukprot:19038_1